MSASMLMSRQVFLDELLAKRVLEVENSFLWMPSALAFLLNAGGRQGCWADEKKPTLAARMPTRNETHCGLFMLLRSSARRLHTSQTS